MKKFFKAIIIGYVLLWVLEEVKKLFKDNDIKTVDDMKKIIKDNF